MRQLTIAERLTAAVLLPLAAMLSVPFLTAVLMRFLDEANAAYAEIIIALVTASIAGAVVLIIARGIVRPIPRWPIPSTPSPMPSWIPRRRCSPAAVK